MKNLDIKSYLSILLLLPLISLAACGDGVDLSAVRSTEQSPIKRYDVVQSLASNDSVVVAGLQNGAVIVSSDKGKTWRRENLRNASMIGLTACPDDSIVGIDFYGKVWSADSSGGSWKSFEIERPGIPLAVACDSNGRWWVAGTRSAISVSEDKGATWSSTDFGEDAQITAIQFLDASYGVATAEFGMVYTTDDGGVTWNRKADMPNEFYPYDAVYVSRDVGYVSGLAGQVLVTKDGGSSWSKMRNATNAPLYRLFMIGGVPHGVGEEGVIARLSEFEWQALEYSDPLPIFFAAGASTNSSKSEASLVAGGPGGLLRVVQAIQN
ncbi:MAG TPA: YCF48-related protein [Stenomitos sp.]